MHPARIVRGRRRGPQAQHLRRRGVLREGRVHVECRYGLPALDAHRQGYALRLLRGDGQSHGPRRDGRPRGDVVLPHAHSLCRTGVGLPLARAGRKDREDEQDGPGDRRAGPRDGRDHHPGPRQRHGRRRHVLRRPARREEHLPDGRLLHGHRDGRAPLDFGPHVPQLLHRL